MRNFFSKLFKFFFENKIAIILITLLTFIVWHKILNQVFLGEGYYYFNRELSFFKIDQAHPFFPRYDNFARLMFDVSPPLLKDNIEAYLLLELLIITILYLSVYAVISKISKSKLIGFYSAVFFMANYVCSFSLFAEGNYQRFVQRVPNFIPAVVSFYFLFKFYNEKKIKDYFICLSFYIFSLLMSHFSSIILPLFLLYPFVQLIQEKKPSRAFLTRVIAILPFIFITFILTKSGDQAPSRSLFQFLFTEPDLLRRTLFQIPLITIPLEVVKLIAKNIASKPLPEPYLLITPYLTIISIIFYSLGGILVYKRRKKLLVLYITSFLTMISSMFLYIYVDVRINPLKYFEADRFFFVPSLFAAICWGIFLQVLFNKKSFFSRLIPIIILVAYLLYNTSLIWSNSDLIQYKSEMLKSFISYVKNRSLEFNNATVIIVPSYLMWPAPMIAIYGDHPGMIVKSEFEGWESKYWNIKENVYVFDYEYQKNLDRTIHPKAGHMVDFTQKFRQGEKIQFLN